jgi:hypothetical protein
MNAWNPQPIRSASQTRRSGDGIFIPGNPPVVIFRQQAAGNPANRFMGTIAAASQLPGLRADLA